MQVEKITRVEFRTLLHTKQGFTLEEANTILKAMKWDDDSSKNFFQIVTRMGKAIARPSEPTADEPMVDESNEQTVIQPGTMGKFKAKWCKLAEESIPGPGELVTCSGQVFKIISVTQRPNEEHFGQIMSYADLEVEAVYPTDPDYVRVYEKGEFHVGRISGYRILNGYFAFDGFNEEGKPRWIQPASDGQILKKKEAEKLFSSLKEKCPEARLIAMGF